MSFLITSFKSLEKLREKSLQFKFKIALGRLEVTF